MNKETWTIEIGDTRIEFEATITDTKLVIEEYEYHTYPNPPILSSHTTTTHFIGKSPCDSYIAKTPQAAADWLAAFKETTEGQE